MQNIIEDNKKIKKSNICCLIIIAICVTILIIILPSVFDNKPVSKDTANISLWAFIAIGGLLIAIWRYFKN